MRNVTVAETMLSLVMPRERASATVGDLLEFKRGRLAFWVAVLSAAAGAVFRQLTFGTIVKSAVLYVVLSGIFAMPLAVSLIRYQPEGWLGRLALYGMVPVSIFHGILLARLLPNREAGGMITLILLRAILVLAVSINTSGFYLPMWRIVVPSEFLPMLFGVWLGRRGTLLKNTK